MGVGEVGVGEVGFEVNRRSRTTLLQPPYYNHPTTTTLRNSPPPHHNNQTYICLILIHLCGLRDEELMMKLRYTAFGLIWFAKLGDGWESIFLEALVLMLFSIPPLTLLLYSTFKPKTKIRHVPLEKTGDNLIDGAFKFLNGATRNLPYDPNSKLYALATTVVGLILLYLENCMDNEIKIFHALASVSFGTGTYFLWTVLPCYEKDNILGSTYR